MIHTRLYLIRNKGAKNFPVNLCVNRKNSLKKEHVYSSTTEFSKLAVPLFYISLINSQFLVRIKRFKTVTLVTRTVTEL